MKLVNQKKKVEKKKVLLSPLFELNTFVMVVILVSKVLLSGPFYLLLFALLVLNIKA